MNVFLWYIITPSGSGNKQLKSWDSPNFTTTLTHPSPRAASCSTARHHKEKEKQRGAGHRTRGRMWPVATSAAQNLLWIKLAQPQAPLHPLLFRDACPANFPSKLSLHFLSLSFLRFCLSQQHEPSVVLTVEGFSSGRLASAGNVQKCVRICWGVSMWVYLAVI